MHVGKIGDSWQQWNFKSKILSLQPSPLGHSATVSHSACWKQFVYSSLPSEPTLSASLPMGGKQHFAISLNLSPCGPGRCLKASPFISGPHPGLGSQHSVLCRSLVPTNFVSHPGDTHSTFSLPPASSFKPSPFVKLVSCYSPLSPHLTK